MVIDVIDELQREYDFEFYLQGISQSPLRAQIYVWEEQLKRGMIAPQHYEFVHGAIKLWGKLIEMKHFEHIPFYPAGLYPDILREMNLDIGICPLIESEFSRFKSCVKFYEYASVGTFTIASNVLPYSKEVNCLTNEWGTMLKGMIDGVDLRKAKLKEQMEFTLLKRDIRKIGDQWNLLFLNLK